MTDLSGLGNCSGSANIAVLSHFGVEACLLPTAVLSAQTGFSSYTLTALDESFENACRSLIEISPEANVVYVGFLTSVRQCRAASKLAEHFQHRGAKLLADPIIGDGGVRFPFIGGELFEEIKGLARRADVITPNITEFCLLTGADYAKLTEESGDTARLIASASADYIGSCDKTVIVTGACRGEDIMNITADKSRCEVTSHRRYGGSYSGTGDVFTSVICAAMARGEDIFKAADTAAGFISHVCKHAAKDIADRNFGLPFQRYMSEYL